MGYKDEELLRLRQKAEEFKKQRFSEDTISEELKESIHDPVTHITKIPVVFEDRILLDGRLTMRVPKDFEQVPDDVVNRCSLWKASRSLFMSSPIFPLDSLLH